MNQSTDIVNIIMPVKNAGSYLHDCLSSIRGQTFLFWRLIAINDHSTDDSLTILEMAASEDNRIHVLNNEGIGIIPALQLALKQCSAPYLSRMDADDLMPANKLELMVRALEKAPPKSIVTGKVKYFSNQPVSEGYQKYEQWLNERIDKVDHWEWVYRECVIASPNWMVRLDDMYEFGCFDGLIYPEDYHLVLNWFKQGFRIVSLPETTLLWREHPQRTSRNSDHYDQKHFFKLKILHYIYHQREDKPFILWGAGHKGRLASRLLDKYGMPFHWMDLLREGQEKTVDDHVITHFTNIEHYQGNAQCL